MAKRCAAVLRQNAVARMARSTWLQPLTWCSPKDRAARGMSLLIAGGSASIPTLRRRHRLHAAGGLACAQRAKPTRGGPATEIRYRGKRVRKKIKAEIGDHLMHLVVYFDDSRHVERRVHRLIGAAAVSAGVASHIEKTADGRRCRRLMPAALAHHLA